MEQKNWILGTLAAAGSCVAGALGGWDTSLQLLLVMMGADYATGLLVAAVWKRSRKSGTGRLDSRAGFAGLCRKGMILTVVWVAVALDKALGGSYARTAVCLFFAGNEGLSLLENLGLMGVPFPGFLKRALEALQEQGDEGGEHRDGG